MDGQLEVGECTDYYAFSHNTIGENGYVAYAVKHSGTEIVVPTATEH